MQGYTSKAQELNEIIEKLFMEASENDCEIICSLFDKIYLKEDGSIDENFRHEYSSISGKIRELNSEELNGQKIFQLDNLLFNIRNVYDYAVKADKPYVKSLFILKDHIGLEVGRIMLVEQIEWKITNGQESVKAQLKYIQSFADSLRNQIDLSATLQGQLKKDEESAKETLENLKFAAEEMEEKIDSIQKDSVTILGIFASIVLSFTAGIGFSTSVLENVNKASPYRIVGAILLIGFVLTNIITILLMYIDRVRRARTVQHGAMKYPKYIKIMNFTYITGFIVDFITWLVLERLELWQLLMKLIIPADL